MKRVLQMATLMIVMAYASHGQTVQFTVKAITPDTLQVYFKPDATISSVVTGISNLTFVLQIPQTFANPQGNWVVIPNTTYLGVSSTNTSPSTANGSKHNTLFSWTSNPNINGTSFTAGVEYLLTTIVTPPTVTSADVVAIDWGNNRLDNAPSGPPLWATSLAIDGTDRTNDASVFYANTSTASPINSGSSSLASSLAITGTPLDIKNLQFAGFLKGAVSHLKWQVETEKNMERYELEYSKDRSKWLTVEFVTALNKENANYEVRHTVDGKSVHNYYRLKIVESSGKFEYSKIINLQFVDTKDDVLLLPNAVNTGESMSLIFKAISEGDVKIVDVTGKLIKQYNSLPSVITTTGMSSGQYYLYVNTRSDQRVLKFTIY